VFQNYISLQFYFRECNPIAPLQKRHLKACSDTKECQADAQAANVKLDGCPVQITPTGMLYTNQADYCFINLCSIFTFVDLFTAYGKPTVVFETLTQQDFIDTTSASNKQFCAFNDLRFEPSCDNWTSTVYQRQDNSLEWTNILTNSDNGKSFKAF
jgi:hypothetical protein